MALIMGVLRFYYLAGLGMTVKLLLQGRMTVTARRKKSMSRRSNGAVSPTSRYASNQVKCINIDSISQEQNIIPSLLKIDVERFRI
jgi:hypothetical protein